MPDDRKEWSPELRRAIQHDRDELWCTALIECFQFGSAEQVKMLEWIEAHRETFSPLGQREASQSAPLALGMALNPLERFALWALTELREHGADLDGGDVQEKLAEFGVVQMVEVTEQCQTEDCPCAEFGFPTQCYRDSAFTAQRRSCEAPSPPSAGQEHA